MGIITTKQCPFCGCVIDRYRGRNPIVGPPTVTCGDCNHIIKTDYKLWIQLNGSEKLFCFIRELFFFPLDILFSVGYKLIMLVILYAIINGIFDFEISSLYDFLGKSEDFVLLLGIGALTIHAVFQKFKGYILLYRLTDN